TATSWRRGCRHTRRAASAPANPVAPATSTRAAGSPSSGWLAIARAFTSLTQRPSDLAHGCLDGLANLRDLAVGERAIRGAELQAQREALAVGADLLAAVEVEDARRAQQLAAGLEHGRAHALRGHVLGHDHREVLEDSGEADQVLIGVLAKRGRGEQRRQVDLGGGD